MKTNNTKKQRKVYPFHHSLTTILLSALALLLCAIGAGRSLYRIIENGIEEFSDVLQHPFLIGISVFCATIFISILVKSQYVVTDEELITQFGFIKSALPIAMITTIEHDRSTHKLTVHYHKDVKETSAGEEFTVFALNPEWADELVSDLCRANPNIDFFFTMTENKPPKDENDNNKQAKNKHDKDENS